MSSNCLDFLNDYADYLSANTDDTISSIRPHPIFFTGINCTGSSWPPPNGIQALEPDDGGDGYTNVSGLFGSMYIPAGWTVQLYTQGGGLNGTFPIGGASQFPILFTDVTDVDYPGTNVSILNAVTITVINWPKKADNTSYTPQNWKFDMCMNVISTIVGARHISSWQAGSTECDDFMNGFCHPVSTQSCAPNSTQPAPLPDQYTACVCLVEENCLRDTFCEPGNTNPSCVQNDAFEEFIPVTCFGKNCSIEGYRWARMQNQKCTITLCQQIINLVGDNIVVKGGSTIWCGNRNISLSPSATPTPAPSPDKGGDTLPAWAWILIGVAVFLLCVAVPIAVLVYRQANKNRVKDLQKSQFDIAHI
jgi:hypothetical protein